MRKAVVAGVAGLLLLAGCGSDKKDATTGSGSGSTAATTPATSGSAGASAEPTGDDTAPVKLDGQVTVHDNVDLPASGEIEMEIDDRYFEPTFVKAKAGQKVTVKLASEGALPHTFTIDAVQVDQAMAPDAKAEVTFTMPASGFLNFYCRFHRASGMQGAFYIG